MMNVIAQELARQWKTIDIKLIRQDGDSNHHVTDCMSTVSATGVYGVAPGRVTSDEINDAVVAAQFAQPISIVTRTMKHPRKQAILCAISSTWEEGRGWRQGTS